MAPHSSTLAWKIPWTEEPGRLQSVGSLRVGHDWATSLSLFTFLHWRRKWQPTPVFLPGESQGQQSLVGCCLWGRTELDTAEATEQQQQHTHILEKAMAPHSSTLAWKIPWTEEPGRLQSMRSHRVRHDWSELAAAAAVYPYLYHLFSCLSLVSWEVNLKTRCQMQGISLLEIRAEEWEARQRRQPL